MADPATLFKLPDGHHTLVVGGTGGIGSAIASALLAHGSMVTITGHDAATVAACDLPDHPHLTRAVLNVTDDGGIAAFVQRFARLDGLVNAAGILARKREFDIETFQRVLDVNLTGTFRMCKACQPLLAATPAGGAIVNIASMNATAALPFIPAYCASKGGVVMLTKSLALAWAPERIRVNALAPGYVETAINAEGRKDRAHVERITARIALGRWAQPADIAGGAVFLLSPAAHYITGTVLSVDGGFLAG